MTWEYQGDYLQQFSKDYKGTIGDRFCRAIRAGCDDPEAVLKWVAKNLEGNDNPEWQQVKYTCDMVSIEAWEFAEHLLDREALPLEEKERLKKEKALDNHGIRNAMDKQAPSEAQLKYLKALGCKIEPKTKLEASDLIESHKQAKESRELPNSVDYDKIAF